MRFRGFAGLALLLSYATLAAGDGGYFPVHATQKLPEIPMQQAVISIKDGVERLLIDSTLNGEGTDFAWIVPVPSEPIAVEKASPAITEVLSEQEWVEITHSQIVVIGGVLLSFVNYSIPWLLVFFAGRRPSATLVVLATLVTLLVLVPNAGGPAGGSHAAVPVPGVDLREASTVGNYEVSVLAATNAQALNQWLTANGYAGFPDGEGVAIADDYAKKHWRFVAAKLHRDGNGLSRPHPLMIVFPVAAPVYPMRLTGLADSKLYLELFAIADGTARVPGMTCDFSDTFDRASSNEFFHESRKNDYPLFFGKTSRMPFAMPALTDLMWPGCTLTKLSATVEPEQMGNDFPVEIGKPVFVQRHFFSNDGAGGLAGLAGILFWGATVVVSTIAWLKYQRRHEDKAYWLDHIDSRRAFFLVLLLTFLMPLCAVQVAVIVGSILIHDHLARWQIGLAVLCVMFAIYFTVFLLYASLGAPQVPRRKILLPFTVLVLLLPFIGLASTGLGTLVYLSLPKTEIKHPGESAKFEFYWSQAESELRGKAPALFAGKSASEIEGMVAAQYPILKRRYDVLTDDNGIFVRLYELEPLRYGRFMRDIRIPQTPQPAEPPPSPIGQGETPK